MYCCSSIGRTARQESAVRSRRNPISKPMRRQSGKMKVSDSKVSASQRDVLTESAADSDITGPVTADIGTDQSKNRKVDVSLGQRLHDTGTAVDVRVDDVFHPPLAERVKLRRMSQPSSDSDTSNSERSKSQVVRSSVVKARSAGMRNSLRHSATRTEKKLGRNNESGSTGAKNQPRTSKLASTKKNSAIRSVASLSKTKPSCTPESVKPGAKASDQNQHVGSDIMALSRLTANKLKQRSKKLVAQELKPKTTISKSGSVAASRLKPKCVALSTRPPKRSCSSAKEPSNTSVDDAAKMPRLKANSKQNVASVRVKSMPVLHQETSVTESSKLAKKSPRKRQQPTPTKAQSKSPKLSPSDETINKRSLRNSDVKAETSFTDDDMPQLSAVEMPDKMKPIAVVVGQSDGPPELDRSPLCDAKEVNSAEQKSGCQSPARCLRDSKDTDEKTSPRRTTAEHAGGDALKNASPKHSSPAGPKHHASTTPVSNCTALSQHHCSISSQVAVTQAVCSMSSQHSKQIECSFSDSQQPVGATQTSCSISSQSSTSPLKTTVSETQQKDECSSRTDSTEASSEIVPYTCPPNNVSGQWQAPCGVPMAPFIITGMYPVMGSGYGCQLMSFPPFATPAMPAATSIISAGSSLAAPPLQYSSYQLPRSAAAPVVPLYMSPVVGPFMQPGSSTPQVNLLPFMSSLPHAAAAVQTPQSSATLILRPSMPPPDHMYCMLPTQQQVKLLLCGRSVSPSSMVCVFGSSSFVFTCMCIAAQTSVH